MRGRFVGLLLVPALTASGCSGIKAVTRTTVLPVLSVSLPAKAPFLKSHMKDGSLYVLDHWAVTESDSAVTGSGGHFDRARRPISTGQYRVPLDSVALFEANVVQTSSAVSAYTVLAAVTAIGAFICLTNPKACFGSCPTFYAEADSAVVQAEAFSSSVAPSLEATDIDALYRAHPRGSTFRLRMTNEALETHVVRYADLLAVPHGEGERVGRTPENLFRIYSRPRSPTNVVSLGGVAEARDAVDALVAFDGRERFSLADSSDLAARETVELEFAAAGPLEGERVATPVAGEALDSLGLLLAARQTLLTTYLYYQTLAYLGGGAADWIAMLERSGGMARPLAESIGKTMGRIAISVERADGTWASVGSVGETGPIATDVVLVPLPANVGSLPVESTRPLRVRLTMAKGMWRLDHVALVRLGAAVTPRRIVPTEVFRVGVPSPEALRSFTDRTAPVVALPGDEVTIVYPLPPAPERFEYFLEARGWYLEWLRDEWKREENAAYAQQIFLDPGAALRRLAPQFKAAEPSLESLFWNSRYEKR